MATLTFRLPNRLYEVHPYMSFLVAVDRERQLRVFDWHRFVSDVAPGLGELPVLSALARNDQLIAGQEHPEAVYELPLLTDDYLLDVVNLGISSVTDLLVYNRTAYIVGPKSVLCVPLQINGHYDQSLPMQIVAEVFATQVKARGGVVVLPCGDDGLEARRAFLWQGQEANLPDIAYSSPKETTRASWLNFDLMRFDHTGPAELLENETVNVPSLSMDATSEGRAIQSFATFEKSFEDMIGQVADPVAAKLDGGFASNGQIYAWKGNELRAWRHEKLGTKAVYRQSKALPCAQVYSGMSFAHGLIFDTNEGTMLVDPRWMTGRVISEGDNLTARAFNASRYYDRTVWSIKTDYVDISTII